MISTVETPKPTKKLILKILKHILVKRRRYQETSLNFFSRICNPQIIKIAEVSEGFTISVVNPRLRYSVTVLDTGKVIFDKDQEFTKLFGKNLQFDIKEYI
jgi:hypothetical protein